MLHSWEKPLEIITKSARFQYIIDFLNKQYVFGNICPDKKDVFNAFKYCDYKDLKVVIIGQDPYHDIVSLNPRICRATGLAFGNHDKTLKLSPSLKNIMEELESDLGEFAGSMDVTLKSWAEQGVLLLNTSLTVEQSKPESHIKLWEGFVELVIKQINKDKPGTIFVLWGNHAKKYKKFIGEDMWVFESAHPSPLSANKGFFGSKPFSKINDNLHIQGKTEIKWI